MTRRADIDPDWLRRRYGMPGATVNEIAAETGYSEITILRRARRLDMNMRPARPDRTKYDEAWLRIRYVDRRMVVADIAAEAGVCVNSVRTALTGSGSWVRDGDGVVPERAGDVSSR